MKLKSVIITLAILILIPLAVGYFQTWRIQSGQSEKLFLRGRVPERMDGFYKGSADVRTRSWAGKEFDASSSAGINIFKQAGQTTKKFKFKTYVEKGTKDPSINVLKIDYDIPGNNLFVRMILDELVQVGPNEYLGKAHIRILPGVTFSLIYFKLEQ